jgi:hypothetical protein
MAKRYTRENMIPCVGSYITCVERSWVLKDVCCRVVNNIMIKYRHLVLRIDDMLNGLLGSCIFLKN